MDLDSLKDGQAMGAPTVSASMATAVLAYSGIAVKMLVDQRLDAQLHTMFMIYETQGKHVRWLETSAPGPPSRYSYRHEGD